MLPRSWFRRRRIRRFSRRLSVSRAAVAVESLEDRTLLAAITTTGGFIADTRISATAPTTNYGTAAALQTDGTPDIATLFRLDLGVVPRNSVVQSVEISFHVSTPTSSTFEIYELLKAFNETQATFQRATSATAWQVAGANGATDRGTTVLGTITPSSTGRMTISLNAAGIAVVQKWVNNPSINNGFILMDYGDSNGLAQFSSRNDANSANRPSFSITYTNDPPTAVNDFYSVLRGGTLDADDKDGGDSLIGNDIDPENAPLTASLVSGPSHGTLTLQANGKFVYTHNGNSATSDSFTYRVSDGLNLSNIATAFISITTTTPTNQAPGVDAGQDASTAAGLVFNLDGTVVDDGLPSGSLTTTWNVFSGPGSVTFGNANAVDTTAVFSAPGTYILRLTANDGQLATSDFVTITVTAAPSNQAPTVNAGPDRGIFLGQSANLDGTVGDDGLPNPPGAVTTRWTKISGPGTVTFANEFAVDTTATFSAIGTYVVQLSAFDGSLSAVDLVTITVYDPNANQAPSVDAGPNRIITQGQSASLDGTASDDGLGSPFGTLNVTWTKVSGPGTVTFANATSIDTTATFSLTGSYVLRLTATDGLLTSSDTMTVTVNAPVNQAPVVDAGPDRTITFGQSASLDGTVTDDGLPNPPGTLTRTWSKVSGPGTVTFANASATDTTATFSVAGSYVLRLTVSDGALTSSDTMTVTVNAVNSAPVVDAGPNRNVAFGQSASLDGTVVDDGNPNGTLTVSWTKSSGPGTVTFANSSAVDTTASFSATGTYVLRLTASDGSLSTSDTMTVVVSTANTAPIVDAGPNRTITLGQSASLDGTISDDGLPNPPGTITRTWTKVSGPGTVAFANASATDTTATFTLDGTYTLRLTASDGALSSSDTMTVTVNAPVTNQAPSVDAGTSQVVLITGTANLNGTVTDDGLPTNPGTLTYSWTKVSGPGTVTFGNAAAVDTTARFSATGSYVLRLTASDGALSASDTVTISVTDTATNPTGIWTSAAELMNLPTSGSAWTRLTQAASQSLGTPDLSDQNDSSNTTALAKALVGVRTGNETYKTQVRNAIMAAIETENGGETLALGRNLAAFVIAAELVGLSSTQDSVFRSWLSSVLNETLSGRTLVSTHEDRPNNWGTMAGGSLAAAAVYLGDQQLIARVAQVFKGWVGDRAAYVGFDFGSDLSWQADPSKPVPINPLGATKDGHSIDGALPEEMRRGGSFTWPPRSTNYPWEALQGAIVQSEILYRAGYTDVYEWEDQALLRAVEFLYDIGWEATGDDEWIMWIIDLRYGTDYATNPQASPGKIMAWTAWTHQFAQNLRLAAPTTDPPVFLPPSAVLTASELAPITDAAIQRVLEAAGMRYAAELANVQFLVADLPDGILASTYGDVIVIDDDAAGYGWFVDVTPFDDSEFTAVFGSDELVARAGGPAEGSVDLLTAVLHELGHVLGFEHGESDGIMEDTLSIGVRRDFELDGLSSSGSAEAAAIDAYFHHAVYDRQARLDGFDHLGEATVVAEPPAKNKSSKRD